MTSQIHDEVQQALKDLQEEAKDLEKVAGHELVRLYNALRAATQAVHAAKRGSDFVGVEIKAGAGAIEDPLHPETAASEPVPQTRERLEEQAAREPDPQVKAKVLADAKAAPTEKQSRAKR